MISGFHRSVSEIIFLGFSAVQIGSFIQTILGDVTVKYVKHWFVAFGKKKERQGKITLNYTKLQNYRKLGCRMNLIEISLLPSRLSPPSSPGEPMSRKVLHRVIGFLRMEPEWNSGIKDMGIRL